MTLKLWKRNKHEQLVQQALKDIHSNTSAKILHIMAKYCYPSNPIDRAELEAIDRIMATR